MKLKTLLLGSAAALLTVGAAQAADLGAEPANYVKICDAFGPGFYYAPGTDTCIKIGGYVFSEVNFGTSIYTNPDNSSVISSHAFATEVQLNVTASSMTEYGPLVGYIEMTAAGSNPGYGALGLGAVGVTQGWLSLGPLLAGYTWSIFNPYFDPSIAQLWTYNGNTRLNQFRLSWAANGIGVAIAAEDYSSRVGGFNAVNVPDLVAALNGSWGNIGLHLGVGWGQRDTTWAPVANTWGVSGTLRFGLDAFAPGDNLTIGANYSAGGDDWINSFLPAAGFGVDGNNYWTIYGAFLHNWTSQVSTSITAAYGNSSVLGNYQNAVIGNITFRPVTNFSVAGEVAAGNAGGTSAWGWTGKIRLRRDFP